jgi:hypothetical protein
MKLDHLKLIGKFEFSNSCALWIIKLSLNLFSKLIGAELDHTSKRESVPHNLFYKCANLQKKSWAQKVFVSRVETELYEPVSRLGRILGDGLTFRYLWKSYLLKSWELDCACSPDQSAMFVGHLGEILV